MLSRAMHLAPGNHHAEMLRVVVNELGRDDEIVTFSGNCLHVGSLTDVDEGGAQRAQWWRSIGADPGDLDDRRLWDHVRTGVGPVVVWHGPIPDERLFAMRACWQLRAQAERVHEISRPARELRWGRDGGPRPSFYDAVGIVGPKVLVVDWKTVRRVGDVEARAKRWEELREHRGILELRGDEFIERSDDAYDARFLAECASWTRSTQVLGRVLAETPVPQAFLVWRIRALITEGRFEARGAPNRMDLPEEIRALPKQ